MKDDNIEKLHIEVQTKILQNLVNDKFTNKVSMCDFLESISFEIEKDTHRHRIFRELRNDNLVKAKNDKEQTTEFVLTKEAVEFFTFKLVI